MHVCKLNKYILRIYIILLVYITYVNLIYFAYTYATRHAMYDILIKTQSDKYYYFVFLYLKNKYIY